MSQVESGRSDSVASRGSLQSSGEVSAAVAAASAPSSRPTDSNDVTSFSIRRPVSHFTIPLLVQWPVRAPGL